MLVSKLLNPSLNLCKTNVQTLTNWMIFEITSSFHKVMTCERNKCNDDQAHNKKHGVKEKLGSISHSSENRPGLDNLPHMMSHTQDRQPNGYNAEML